MRVTQTTECQCPYCGRRLSAASHDGELTPRPGDLSICVECCRPCIFCDDMTLRRLTDDEQTKVDHDASTQSLIALLKGVHARRDITPAVLAVMEHREGHC